VGRAVHREHREDAEGPEKRREKERWGDGMGRERRWEGEYWKTYDEEGSFGRSVNRSKLG
jgi:hypothetical protein